MLLSKFCLKEGEEEGQEFRSLEVRGKLITLKKKAFAVWVLKIIILFLITKLISGQKSISSCIPSLQLENPNCHKAPWQLVLAGLQIWVNLGDFGNGPIPSHCTQRHIGCII